MLETGSENRLSIRMNHCDIGSTTNKFYAGFSGGSADQWTAYSLDFAPEGESTFGLAIRLINRKNQKFHDADFGQKKAEAERLNSVPPRQ